MGKSKFWLGTKTSPSFFFGKALQGTKAVKDPIAPSMIWGMKTNSKKQTAKKQSQKNIAAES